MADKVLHIWDVVVARNLIPCSRAKQEYIWLEVGAASQLGALAKAKKWAFKNNLEPTDMIRRKTPHHGFAGNLKSGRQAPILWHIPVISDMPCGMAVRNPVNGERVGYVAFPEDVETFNGELKKENLILLMSRLSSGGEPIAVCPAVFSIELSFRENPVPGQTRASGNIDVDNLD